MKAIWYAEALYGALHEGKTKSESDLKKLFAHFRKVVSSRGHDKLLPFIAREFERKILREESSNEILLVTANAKSTKKWSHAIDAFEKDGTISKGLPQKNVIDESIIGGFQIRSKDILIDGSYKKSLTELYRKITSK